MLRLLICDDSAEARLAARTMLANDGQIEIVGEAGLRRVVANEETEHSLPMIGSSRPEFIHQT